MQRLNSGDGAPAAPLRSRRAADRLAEDAATFVARNRVRKSIQGREDGPSYVLQVWDFMVEVRGADGQPTRLVISPDARRKLGKQRQKANAVAKKAKFDAKLSERD